MSFAVSFWSLIRILYLTGKTKIIKHKKQKATEVLPEIYNTKLNNELDGNA